MFAELLLKLRVAILRLLFRRNEKREREQEPEVPKPTFIENISSTSTRGSVGLHIYTCPGFQRISGRKHPVVIDFHGGGFTAGAPSMDARFIATVLETESKPIVVGVKYGLAPETPFPGAIQDAVSAISWLLNRGAEKYSLDTARIVLVGFSAGGSLALTAPMWIESQSIKLPQALRGVVAIYPGLDYRTPRPQAPSFIARFLSNTWDDAFFRRSPIESPFVSPAAAGDDQLQAALPRRVALYPVAHDHFRKQAESLRERLEGLGKQVTGFTEPDAFHAWDKYPIRSPNTGRWAKREEWFSRIARDIESMLNTS